MASSTVASRLSSRLRPIALLKLHKGNSLSFDAPLLKSVSPSRSSAARRISRSSRGYFRISKWCTCVTSGAELLGINDAVAQRNSFSSVDIELALRV